MEQPAANPVGYPRCRGVSSPPRLVLLTAFLVFFATSAYLALFASILWRVGDEGTLVYGAARVVAGQVPYRDFFEPANPLSFYWLAAWFAVFGSRVSVARFLLVLTGALTNVVVFGLAYREYGFRSAIWSAVFCGVLGVAFWPVTNHHWDSNLFFLLVVCCLAAWQTTTRRRWAFVAGAGAAVTAGFMIQKGALAFAVAIVVFALGFRGEAEAWRKRLAPALLAAGGALLVVGAVVAWFVAIGAQADAFYANFVFPATNYGAINRLPYGFFLSDEFNATLSLLGLLFQRRLAFALAGLLSIPLAVAAIAPAACVLMALRRRSGDSSKPQAMLWVGAFALWVSEMHRPDLFHILYGAPLMLVLLAGEYFRQRDPPRALRVAAYLIAACTLALGVWKGAVAGSAPLRQETRSGVLRAFYHDDALRFLLESTRPGDFVFVYPYYPMYYFLAAVENPTRYGVLVHGYNTRRQFEETVADLERRKPKYVLWDTFMEGDGLRRWFPNYVVPPGNQLVVEPYLTDHYSVIGIKNGFRVLERRSERDVIQK